MGKAKKSYTAAPQVDPAMSERLGVILEVLAGQRSVSEGARSLKLSRNHFQTILHRGLAGLVEAIESKASGRPAKPQEVAQLEGELQRLRQENARLQERLGTTDRLLQAASGLLQGRIRPARQTRAKRSAASGDDKGDSEPERGRSLGWVDAMRDAGLTAPFAAAIAGVHESTVRRWRQRMRAGESSRSRRCASGRIRVSPAAQLAASRTVRALRGQIGAEALRRIVTGLSRRQAARVKAETLTAMERERKARLNRVRVSVPGVMRGMDGLHVRAADGCAHALICADAAIPYRTSVTVGERYDTRLVERALAFDIHANGAPVVYRLDRAKAHDSQPVRELLEAHGILVLHGPPHYPRFYGQLERQNREHRAWDETLGQLPLEALQPCLDQMLIAVNSLWRRRTLAWSTASEAWSARPRLVVDRSNLRLEVKERTAKLQRSGKHADLAERLAIEQALTARGYLRQIPEGWC